MNYDFIVIGGGSGGLAAGKAAAAAGAKAVLFDYVEPTVHGTKWGLGGTCVNVGCIPKKLMHRSARVGHSLSHDALHYGWKLKNSFEFNWDDLVNTIRSYIKSLNFSYRRGLLNSGCEYVNAYASLLDSNTVQYTFKGEVTAKYILVAVGGRPVVDEKIPGLAELAITSDDLFYLDKAPGKTLVVGASYIALECAGFLTEFGYDTTVCVRSILLRGFDRQCAAKIGDTMKELGTKFYDETLLKSVCRKKGSKLIVSFNNRPDEEFDTVLVATGRCPQLKNLGLEKCGIKIFGGKIVTDRFETTTCSNVFAIGDTALGRPELTPVAIKAGELLVNRLFRGSTELMQYEAVPTVVFTPVEYGCCGLSEEAAIACYGEDNIEVFIYEFSPIEVSAAHWEKAGDARADECDKMMSPTNISKLVCRKDLDNRVVGFHAVALHAGEMTQGFSIAVKAELTKAAFDSVVGLHPTDAESFCTMSITRRSGLSWVAAGGCGGGKCG